MYFPLRLSKRLLITIAIMITLLLAASALAGTVSVFSLPDIATDSASGINPSNSYLCALNFGGGTNPIFINGVPFQPVHLNGKGTGPDECHPFFSGSDTNHAGTWSVSATVAGGDGFADDSIGESFVGVPFQSDGAMSALLGHMSYVRAGAQDLTNGSTIQMHFGGLTAGTKYSLRYYYRQWSKKRYINFSFNNGETEDAYAGNPLDLDAGGAGFVDYDFTAVTNEISMKMEVCTAGYGPHIFGVTLQPLLPGTGKHGGVIKSAVASKNLPSDKYGVGWWIWASETGDLQTCRFWKSFVIPETASVRSAILRITADNSYRVFLDGQDLGHGADWTSLTAYDLSLLLKKSGQHVLAVEAANDFGPAGVILGLNIQLNNGELITVGSDESWRVVPNDERDWTTREYAYLSWPKAKIVGAAGASPWKVLSWDWGTLIYNAPKLQPLVMPFWQKLWFQVSIFSFLLISIAIGIYLTGRLILNSKEHSVIQRERARIARDLHDSLSAGLTQLVVYGESTKNDLRAYPEVQPDLDEICLKARSLLDSLKETIWIVNSQRDSLRDLIMHLCDYTEMFLKPTGIRCRFDLAADLPTLPCDVGIRRNLMLAVKEALCNVIKYSEAQELQLRIHWDDHKIVVRVEDDGKGFDPAKASKERDGLHNMEQRAKDAGGRCSVVSAPGAGCQVEISVPLRRLRRFQLWSRTQPEDHHDQLTFPLKPGTAQVAERSRAKSA